MTYHMRSNSGKFPAIVDDWSNFSSDDEEAAYRRPEIPTPLLALNEVFVGESHAARVSYLEVQLDDGEVYKQKNSTLLRT